VNMISKNALVEEGMVVGDSVRICDGAHICAGARIGEGVMIGEGCYVGGSVSIGRGSRLQNGVQLFGPARLGENVFVGPGVIFTNVSRPRAELIGNREIREVWDGATIGARAVVMENVGLYSMVGAGAVVTHRVVDYELVTGVPAAHAGWVGWSGCPLEWVDDGRWICPRTGIEYHESMSGLMGLRMCMCGDCEAAMEKWRALHGR